MQTLADIGEDELVRRLTAGLRQDKDVLAGPGDDCALVRAPRPGEHLVLKTDTVAEGVHFLPDTTPQLVGRKAMARVLSDFAAMAATPRHALITLIAPPATAVKRVLGVYDGLKRMAAEFGVNIVGGETSRGSQMVISVSLTGTVRRGRALRRDGGKAGDALLVTGRLGGSIRGRHLRFQPRLAEARWLAEHFKVHAMMDISDGLAMDLPRLTEASGLHFEIDMEALPGTRGCTVRQAWSDGEDYELLMAVPNREAERLLAAWRRQFPELPLTLIGRLTKNTSTRRMSGGWDHFARA
jgi:thiamine-monophosphate kinase